MDNGVEGRFRDNLNLLIDLMVGEISTLHSLGATKIEPSKLNLAVLFLRAFSDVKLLNIFITHSWKKCWSAIKEKNVEFFLANAHTIFGALPITDQVDLFRVLFESRGVDDVLLVSSETRTDIWKYLTNMVKCSIKYVAREVQKQMQGESSTTPMEKGAKEVASQLSDLILEWSVDLTKF